MVTNKNYVSTCNSIDLDFKAVEKLFQLYSFHSVSFKKMILKNEVSCDCYSTKTRITKEPAIRSIPGFISFLLRKQFEWIDS